MSGLSQMVSTWGWAIASANRTVIVGSGADAASQATGQVMNRFLNRLPTITIREGQRVTVYVTSDIDLPPWKPLADTSMLERR